MEHESLWTEIDHAERCLVSALYDDAVKSATSTLCALCRELDGVDHRCSQEDDGPCGEAGEHHELISMIEAAGMVLVQALNQMGRSSDIFPELISTFGSAADVPYTLIFTGSCLQLSTSFPPASARALEEFLSAWSYPERGAKDFMMRLQVAPEDVGNDDDTAGSSFSTGISHWFALSRTDYLKLTEIFTIDILAKLQRNPRSACLWIKNSTLSEEDKAATLAKLDPAFQSEKKKPSWTSEETANGISEEPTCTASDPVQKSTKALATSDAMRRTRVMALDDNRLSGSVVNSRSFWKHPFMTSILKVIELVLNRLGWTFKRTSSAGKLPPKHVLITRALTVLVVSALLRKRQRLARWILQVGGLAKIYCMDLWQLAFSVHLNPLAAV